MSDIGERIKGIETTLIYIKEAVDEIKETQIAHNLKDDDIQSALQARQNSMQGQIDATGKDLTWAKWIGTSLFVVAATVIGWLVAWYKK